MAFDPCRLQVMFFIKGFVLQFTKRASEINEKVRDREIRLLSLSFVAFDPPILRKKNLEQHLQHNQRIF